MTKGTLKILSLEDLEEDFFLITHALKKSGMNFTAKRVDSKEEFSRALEDFGADVILCDHSLPQFNSNEALRIFHQRKLQIPFILVTGAVSEEFAVSSLKHGADDYVLKSNLARLPNVIDNALKQKEAERAKVEAAQALARQNETLTKINKELDSFVYSISHNLRAPLMSVLGLLDLAQNESNSTVIHQYHEMMKSSVCKLDETLKEILEYSRNARQGLVIAEIDFQKIINDNFERMQFMPGYDRIRKEIFIQGEGRFFSDNYRLSLILNNLISNAIKYSDPLKETSFIHITISLRQDNVLLVFKDNGIGIEQDYIHKVFNMFFRATEKNEGAGLGLYIVKEAVEKLGGHIELESQVGKGVVFKIELPNLIHQQRQELAVAQVGD
ncbi:MAG TPA: hybrid sensor histidine kinase/response regulator [Chryseosolibacter sp.]|nr:hybrid sensor histidine kinase/response regulator [Chryseosolibacter sp.]